MEQQPHSPPDQPSPEQLREEIAQTREELGDTVEALAAKADVKGQAQARVVEARERLSERKDEVFERAREAAPESAGQGASQVAEAARGRPVPFAAAGAFTAGLLVGFLIGRRS